MINEILDCVTASMVWKKRLNTHSTRFERNRAFRNNVNEVTARIAPTQLVLFDVGYVVDYISSPSTGEKCVVFFVILAVVIWMMQPKELHVALTSRSDLI